jgi:hypothetical protein
LGDASLGDELSSLIVSGLASELAEVDFDALVTRRDRLLLAILKIKT